MSAVQRNGMVLVICAPSGAGKTTLVKRLLSEFPHFGFSISHTTRAPREGEVHNKDYYFTSVMEFKEKRDMGFFAEWAQVHGNFYGTPLAPTLEMLEKGQDVIFDVDIQGAAQLRLTLPSAMYIFIMPPSLEILEKRLVNRGTDNKDVINQRIRNAAYEISQAQWFDYWIINDDLEVAYDQLRAAYIASTLSPKFRPHLVRDILGDESGETL